MKARLLGLAPAIVIGGPAIAFAAPASAQQWKGDPQHAQSLVQAQYT